MDKTALGLVLLFCALPAAAAVYKHVDANGVVSYSDKPPQENAQPLHMPTSAPARDPEVDARRAKARAVSDALDEEWQADAQAKAKDKAEKAEQTQRCHHARDQLTQLRKASGVYQLNKTGEREFLDQASRTRHESELAETIRKHCH